VTDDEWFLPGPCGKPSLSIDVRRQCACASIWHGSKPARAHGRSASIRPRDPLRPFGKCYDDRTKDDDQERGVLLRISCLSLAHHYFDSRQGGPLSLRAASHACSSTMPTRGLCLLATCCSRRIWRAARTELLLEIWRPLEWWRTRIVARFLALHRRSPPSCDADILGPVRAVERLLSLEGGGRDSRVRSLWAVPSSRNVRGAVNTNGWRAAQAACSRQPDRRGSPDPSGRVRADPEAVVPVLRCSQADRSYGEDMCSRGRPKADSRFFRTFPSVQPFQELV